MDKNFVVLMMGYTGSGKSTVAKKLAENISCDLYHSAVIRKELGFKFSKKAAEDDFFLLTSKKRESMDKKVYAKLAEKCKKSLTNEKNVIIDAGHFFKWQRENIYEKVKDLSPELFIIKVECPKNIILKRLKTRKNQFSKSEFNETPSIKAYESSKIVTEDPEEDILPNKKKPTIIKYNSYTKDINVNTQILNNNLNKIVNVLK